MRNKKKKKNERKFIGVSVSVFQCFDLMKTDDEDMALLLNVFLFV